MYLRMMIFLFCCLIFHLNIVYKILNASAEVYSIVYTGSAYFIYKIGARLGNKNRHNCSICSYHAQCASKMSFDFNDIRINDTLLLYNGAGFTYLFTDGVSFLSLFSFMFHSLTFHN